MRVLAQPVHELFANSDQLQVPFYQRGFVWKERDFRHLWNSIHAKHQFDYFLGSVLLKNNNDDRKYIIIDGQQRLTTLSIIFRIVRHILSDDIAVQNVTARYLWDEDGVTPSLTLSNFDDPSYKSIIANEIGVHDGRLIDCYNFFSERLNDLRNEEVAHLYDSIRNRFKIVSIIIDSNQDEQQIFDSINSTGQPLTVSELIKNKLYSAEEVTIFNAEWKHWFGLDFWNSLEGAGSQKRVHIDWALHGHLTTIIGAVEIEQLNISFNEFLKTHEKAAFREGLHASSATYKAIYSYREDPNFFIHKAGNPEEIDYFKLLSLTVGEFKYSSLVPLVLNIAANMPEGEKDLCYKAVCSWITRRKVAKMSSSDYPRFVNRLLSRLRTTGWNYNNLILALTESGSVNDDTFSRALSAHEYDPTLSRLLLFGIANYMQGDNIAVLPFNKGKLTVEHILPKKWQKNYNPYDEENLNAAQIKQVQDTVNKLGNLTLLNARVNAIIGNRAWERKRLRLTQYSSNRITSDFINDTTPLWNGENIANRGRALIDASLNLWPAI